MEQVKDIIREYYESYLEEHRYEFGDSLLDKALSYERFCELYDIDESTSEEELYQIFSV